MITPSFGLTATERVLPKLALDFTTASLDSRITFTRAGNTATRINSSGYVETVAADIPRFDYDPVTLVCKGLLIEESRTNLLNYSQTFGTSGGAQNNWADSANLQRVSTTRTSPDNTGNALEIKANGAANQTIISTAAAGSSAARSFSVWLKRVTGTGDIQYTLDNGSNWTTQAITTSWVRYTFAATTANQQVGVRITTDGDVIQIWGAQLEAGAFATSYIPTTTGTAQRNADVATMTGTNFSSWYNATEGTLVSYSISNTANAASTRLGLGVSDGTTSNRIVPVIGSATQTRALVTNSGVLQADLYSTVTSPYNTLLKTAIAYKQNNFLANANAGTTQTDTVGNVPTVTTGYLGSSEAGTNTFMLNGTLQKVFYYSQCLTSAEVQAFTK